MHDHFHEHYEWDGDNQLTKKKRVAHDGERITFTTISDHAAYGFSPTFADGSVDHTNPFQPGYRFADTNDPARVAAQVAYDERNKRMATAWMRKGEPQQQADAGNARNVPRTRRPDEAQDAYAQKVARLDYRNRRHAR